MRTIYNMFIEDNILEKMNLDLDEYEHLNYSTIFVDLNEGEFLGSVHENDGEWRDEYFNPIFEDLGIKIKPKNYSDLSDEEKVKLKEVLSD